MAVASILNYVDSKKLISYRCTSIIYFMKISLKSFQWFMTSPNKQTWTEHELKHNKHE